MINFIVQITPALMFIWSTHMLKKAIDKKEYGIAVAEGFWVMLCISLISIQMFIAGIKSMNRDFIYMFISWLENM